jgi:hypothetical protein
MIRTQQEEFICRINTFPILALLNYESWHIYHSIYVAEYIGKERNTLGRREISAEYCHLDFSGNKIGPEGAVSISESILLLTRLRTLKLRCAPATPSKHTCAEIFVLDYLNLAVLESQQWSAHYRIGNIIQCSSNSIDTSRAPRSIAHIGRFQTTSLDHCYIFVPSHLETNLPSAFSAVLFFTHVPSF